MPSRTLAAAVSVLFLGTSAFAAERVPVSDAAGRLLASVVIESRDLDTVEVSARPGAPEALVVVRHGRDGGASLLLVASSEVRVLVRTGASDSLSRAAWSVDGTRFALARTTTPTWLADRETPRLQAHGRLLLGDASGRLAPATALDDVERVLGWIGSQTVVFTRSLPGDLPEERPYTYDLASGTVTALLDAATPHAYALSLVAGALYYSRSARMIVTEPGAEDSVDVVRLDPRTLQERVLATEQGWLPADFRMQGGRLVYTLDGTFTARSIDLATGASETFALPPPLLPTLRSAHPDGDLAMPYVHQVYDTPDDFNGNWACGPTSTIMCIQHHNRLNPWPITVSWPSKHTSDWGAYDAKQYTAFGSTFNRVQNDASGVPARGAYGWCTDGGGAWAWRMQDYAKKHNLSSDFDGTATFTKLKGAIDAGKTVALSTQLTSAGHIVAIKGYTTDGKLVANDPYGNKNLGYKNYQGENAIYTWSQIAAKWFITVYGSVTPVTPPNAAPKGALDAADCSQVAGWTQDPDEPAKAIDAHVYFGGPAGGGAKGVPVTAGDKRDDLCGALGSCNHGFHLLSPLSLHDGAPHAIHAYGIDTAGGTNPQLSGSPKTLNCPATPPAGVKRHVTNPDVLAAWKFDDFWDRMKVTDAQLAALATEKDVPPAPAMIRADGAPEVWLLDQGFKRHVPSAEVAAHWRLDLAAVQAKTRAEVDAIPTAKPLRDRPVTVIGSGVALYLVDDALPVPAGPDAGAPGPDAATPVAPRPDAGVALDGSIARPPGSADASQPAAALTGPVEAGCGCGSTATGALPMVALAALVVGKRRRTR